MPAGDTAVTGMPNIVLVHGAWADGSCWDGVIERLQADGYNVTAPQFPESSLADDVNRLRQVPDRQDGPTVVCAHSYGGHIMTALGNNAPNVVGLVYIAGFGLDEGESIGQLLAQGPPTPATAHIDVDNRGFAWLPADDFLAHFAPDVEPGHTPSVLLSHSDGDADDGFRAVVPAPRHVVALQVHAADQPVDAVDDDLVGLTCEHPRPGLSDPHARRPLRGRPWRVEAEQRARSACNRDHHDRLPRPVR